MPEVELQGRAFDEHLALIWGQSPDLKVAFSGRCS